MLTTFNKFQRKKDKVPRKNTFLVNIRNIMPTKIIDSVVCVIITVCQLGLSPIIVL